MCVHTESNKQNLMGTSDEKKKICLNNFLRNKLFKGDSGTNKPKKKDARILGANLAQRCICAVLSVIQKQGGANMENTNSSCLIS